MKKLKIQIKNTKFLVFPFVLFFVVSSFSISHAQQTSSVIETRPDTNIKINITLNTQGETVNVISGEVKYSEELFDFKIADESKSVISIWIDKFSKEGGVLHYSGMIPGGYKGDNASIASLLFYAKKEGVGTIAVEQVKAFRNDGEGTEINLPASAFVVKISKGAPMPAEFSTPPDVTPPDSFPIYLTKDSSMFDNKWYIVFLTQDKDSGIDHYEVSEKKDVWERAESPYVLHDQTRSSYLYVKAVDRAGNEIVSELSPISLFSFQEWYLFGAGIFIIILCGIIIRKMKRRKK